MKKLLYTGLALLTVAGISSCKDDKDPQIDTSKTYSFTLNESPYQTSLIDLSTKGNVTFSVYEQPEYGITVAPNYGLEISLKPDFTALTTEPVYDSKGREQVVPGTYALTLASQTNGVLVARMSDIANGLNLLNGLFDADMYINEYGQDGLPPVQKVYVRATASLGSGTAAIATACQSNNYITLDKVQGYSAFQETFWLSVPGNANGWEHHPNLIYSETNAAGQLVCKGFAVVDGAFKFTDGDWDGAGNWGGSKDVSFEDGAYTFTLNQNPDGYDGNNDANFNVNGIMKPGLYYFEVTLSSSALMDDTKNKAIGSALAYPVETISLPGVDNGYDYSAGQLTQSSDYSTWTGTYNVTSGGWLISINESSDIVLGGTNPSELLLGTEDSVTPITSLTGSSVTVQLGVWPWTVTVE